MRLNAGAKESTVLAAMVWSDFPRVAGLTSLAFGASSFPFAANTGGVLPNDSVEAFPASDPTCKSSDPLFEIFPIAGDIGDGFATSSLEGVSSFS
jgi:hypothetical protein